MDFVECTVLEVGEYVAVPYAGKLFSDLGADVIKLEPPEGDVARRVGPYPDDDPDPDASGFFAYLNTGKRSATLPRSGPLAGNIAHDLIDARDVDLVLADAGNRFGLDPSALSAAHEDASVVAVSGYGATGPYRDDEAPDLVAWAESGHMNTCGYPDGPPMRPRIKAADYWAGQVAAMSALGALLHRDLCGEPGQFVDVSKREAAVSTMEDFITAYSWTGKTTHRTGHGSPDRGDLPGGKMIYEAADGHVAATPTGSGRWEAFCREMLGRHELAEDDRFATPEARGENRAEMSRIIEEYTREHGKHELVERFQALGIPSGVTSTPEDLADFEHLRERAFWQEVPLPSGERITVPGFPLRIGDETVDMARAPRLGEHTDELLSPLGYDVERLASTGRAGGIDPDAHHGSRSGAARDRAEPMADPPAQNSTDGLPLDGVRVLDLTWVYAGPHATKFLAALGADVVRVESRRKPDVTRSIFTHQFDADETGSTSAYYNEHSQGKRAMTLDLTTDRGRSLALELAAEADVLMENFSPGFLPSVGLDADALREANGDLVYVSMPGVGARGPASSYRVLGQTLQSMAGLDHISGLPDDPPTTPGHNWPDPTGGYAGAFAALLGLYRREQSGEGVAVELPQLELAVSFLHKPLVEHFLSGDEPERTGVRDEDDRYVQGVYPCAGEDRWAVVAVETDAQWARLCRVIGRPDLVDDDRFASQYDRLSNHDAVDEVIASWTRGRSREEVRERLQDHEVPAGIVADERDLVEFDPQLRAREYFTIHDHPEVGQRTYQGVPFVMERCDVAFRSRSPLFDEHTEEVLAEWLGMSGNEIDRDRERAALY